MSNLKDKIAVVTGGSAGIGFARAEKFIAQGAKVVITGRNQQAIDIAVEKLVKNSIGICADAVNLSDTENLVKLVK